jgi:AhpC/TSA family
VSGPPGKTDGPLSFRDEDAPPSPKSPPPAKPPGISRYGWWFGILVFLILVYIGFNTLQNAGEGTRGIEAGHPLPPFAAPLALSGLQGDANVATGQDQGPRGQRPACSVRGHEVLNSCQLVSGAPSVLAFLATRGGDCSKQLDLIERARPEFPGVRFAAVAIRGSRSDLRADIRRHGWGFPVAYDHDGAVANLYGISVCPTVTFAYPGGTAMRTSLGLLNAAKLNATLRELVQGSEQRGWKPPR